MSGPLAFAVLAATAVVPSVLYSPAAIAAPEATAPTVQITTAPTTSVVGTPYTFSGTVADDGTVTSVEVSTDGGVLWRPATYTQTTWTHTYTPSASGTAQLRVRASDNEQLVSAEQSASATVAPRVCPCSLWSDGDTPATPDAADASALELGLKWQANSNGYVRGVKFYKGPNNSGTHVGSLWTTGGVRLATGTFANETAGGWQTLLFSVPVAVQSGQTYIVSYLSPTGHFSLSGNYFATSGRHLEPLTAPQAQPNNGNGVFRAGAGFPDLNSSGSNYWVDVVWAPDAGADTRAPGLVTTQPKANAGTVGLQPSLSAQFDEQIDPATVEFTLTGPGNATVAGTVSATGPTTNFTLGTPLATGTTYTATVRARDAAGNQADAYNWTFTTGSPRPANCPCTLWDDFSAPLEFAADDGQSVEVGTKVRFDGRGEVLGVRFYKGAANTGTHTGSLWSAAGVQLATGTFVNETSTGWQTLLFSSPVAVQANTTYVVSYLAPHSGYGFTSAKFANEESSYGAIHALKDGVDGGNGVFKYGSGFPNSSHNATNYWVDVVYRNGLNGDTTAPTLVTRTPAADATGAALSGALTLEFDEPVDPASTQISLTDPAGATLNGAVTAFSPDGKTITWTPTAALVGQTKYEAKALVADANGNPMSAVAKWSFTAGAGTGPVSLFSRATVPDVQYVADGGLIELGVRFGTSHHGRITAVRFYKGVGNTGTHTGSLWSPEGALLATGTFSGETATGWQTLTFAQPVTVLPGRIYTASYTTTTGHAVNYSYFQNRAVEAPPLTAPGNTWNSANGVFKPGGGFPTTSHQGNNYWVDVEYVATDDYVAPTGTGHTPLTDATAVDVTSTVTASYNEKIDLANTTFTVTDGAGGKITGTVARSADEQTAIWTAASPLAPGTVYKVSVKASDLAWNTPAEPITWQFTTTGTTAGPWSLFSAASTPKITVNPNATFATVGVRFTPTVNGKITAIKFYKGEENTGTHTGRLWAVDGKTLLKTGTFTNESTSGWQTLTLDQPVDVTAGTQYIASYYAPTGKASYDAGYFIGYSVTAGNLTAPQWSSTAPNGVVGTDETSFPESYATGGNNYWVDVVFTTP
ncbi:hypothetical protein GCM10022243_02400 [Saccharothrix violaceirubra]|uniref:Methionine-rich copper-binding protein CopC n=1 Tax=Saccharothrix violaceirubra TaxID=413306 RepID=A0A7W7T4R3_9PSEU|nr:DUF4082 domain-containing protein [Saccharothrix violaceirubra]MBB4965997.1 methionine-rich copper-binding protein CopC [Saccharothrix violaceirubra]